MTSEPSEKVKRLVQAALELDANERGAFLAKAYAEEPSLREELDSLVSAHVEASDLDRENATKFRTPTRDAEEEPPTWVRSPSDSGDKASSEKPGHRIGRYRIVREIGRGGMGVVYEAEQQEPRRSVAVKVIRGEHYLDEHHVRLFQREGHALARLKHPGIAGIYEAGRTEEGHHFFAMELVTGESLSSYLTKRPENVPWKHELRSGLELFVKICEAVNYAHQRGVIHRDLKPSNIIVTTDADSSSSNASPQIKILDFGLARITDPDTADITSMTAMGRIQGTLPYMSPEQARGHSADIDLRSDIYSLGAVLYEMVTGKRPYHVDPAAPLEAIRVICEEEPKRPSAASTAELDPDVETILLKALEKDPSDRYQSALALAEDIERYLTDRPILAHPPSTMYQLKKLVSRHKMGFGFMATLLLLVLGFAVVTTVQSARIAAERDRAEQEAAKAIREAAKTKAINDFLQDVLGSTNPRWGLGRDVSVLEALDAASERIGETFSNEPEIEAAVQNTIGRTNSELGRLDAAESMLRSALETRRRTLGVRHPDVAESLNSLAELEMSRGDLEAAEDLLREALSIGRALEDSGQLHLAESLNDLGILLASKGDDGSAEPLYRESLSIYRTLLGNESQEALTARANLAVSAHFQGDYERAESLYRENQGIIRKRLGEQHPDFALSQHNLAFLLYDKGDYEQAERGFRDALTISVQKLGESHSNNATILGNLAMVLVARRRHGEAKSLFQQAIQIDPDVVRVGGPWTAERCSRYAQLLVQEGRYREAEEYQLSALEVVEDRYNESDQRTSRVVSRLVNLYEAWGMSEKAAEYRAMLEKAQP